MSNFRLWKDVAAKVTRGEGVGHTSQKGLNLRTFRDGDQKLVAIQQNPNTRSEWASLARNGHDVVQFKDTETNQYVGVSVDGRIEKY